MEDNRTEHQKIETFADITGYSYDISKQLLEAANFNMGVAIESYYGGFSEEDELHEQRKQNRLRRKRLFAARSTSPKPSTAEGGGPDCKRQRLQLQIPPVNQSQPITRIQIQLPGDIITEVYLNYSHTIGHLRTALIIKFPALKNYLFSLSLMEPPRKLLFNESTLGEEGVINCPVVLSME